MSYGGKRQGAGRPKGSMAAHTLEAQAFRQYLIGETIKNKEVIVASLMDQAKAGKIPAIKEILDKVIGKTLDLNDLIENENAEKLIQINNLLKQMYERTKVNKGT